MILTPSSKKILDQLGKKNFVTALRRGGYTSGKEMTNFLRSEMTKKGRSGRTYKIYRGLGGRLLKKPRLHQASAVGEFPAVITGAFRKSVDFKVQGLKLTFGSGLGGLKYAEYLEKIREPVKRTAKMFDKNINTNIVKELNKAVYEGIRYS